MSLLANLPELPVIHGSFGEVTADVTGGAWPGIERAALTEVVSGALPAQATWIRLGWDQEDFRVLFEIEDDDPWATLTERKAKLYTEEVVEVFLDPAGDLAAYFELEVNPLNACLDLMIRRQRRGLFKDFGWVCEGLRTAVKTMASGWAAEFAIPFTAVGARAPIAGEQWRANFCRIDRPKGLPRELSAWSPTGAPLFHVPERFGVIRFVGSRCKRRGWPQS